MLRGNVTSLIPSIPIDKKYHGKAEDGVQQGMEKVRDLVVGDIQRCKLLEGSNRGKKRESIRRNVETPDRGVEQAIIRWFRVWGLDVETPDREVEEAIIRWFRV